MNGKTCPKGLHEAIAKLAKKSPTDLFQHYQCPQKKSIPPKPKAVEEEIGDCTKDHSIYNEGVYHEVESHYYFEENRKWNGINCDLCSKSLGKGKQYHPKPGHCIYVCNDFNLEKCNCRVIVCGTCYVEQLEQKANSSSGRVSRRSRNQNDNKNDDDYLVI